MGQTTWSYNPGDLGRRITLRRSQLGISRDELARRAGMASGYIDWLEEQPAQVTANALHRLSVALQCSTETLLGAHTDAATEGLDPTADAHLEPLEPTDCWAAIGDGGVGRVALAAEPTLAVFPVNYAVAGDVILVRTGLETPLACTARAQGDVAFEVDAVDSTRREGWSVLVTGRARLATTAEAARLRGHDTAQPWAGGLRPVLVAIEPRRVTGRRIRHW